MQVESYDNVPTYEKQALTDEPLEQPRGEEIQGGRERELCAKCVLLPRERSQRCGCRGCVLLPRERSQRCGCRGCCCSWWHVTTVLGLASSRGAGVVERLLNQVHGTCRGLRRGLLFFAFLNTLVPGIAKAKVPKIGIDSIFTTNFSKR